MTTDSGYTLNFNTTISEYYGTALHSEKRNYGPDGIRIFGSIFVESSTNFLLNCNFTLTNGVIVLGPTNECFYPLSFSTGSSEPAYPTVVFGGDVIKICLDLTVSVLSLEQLAFFVADLHPALLLVDHVFTSDNGNIIYTDMVNAHSSESTSTLLVGNINLASRDVLQACITFRVQPYVLPRASLYFSFKVYYFTYLFLGTSFMQSYSFFEEYSSSDIMYGSLSLILPSYATENLLMNAYPPHVGGVFLIDIPILVPCISTDINLILTLPEFTSEVNAMFFTNITNVNIAVPENLVYISELCNYDDPMNFISSSCDIENVKVVDHDPEGYSTHEDKLYNIHLGPILYNMTGIEGCILNSPTANCTCLDQEISVSLRGHVLNISDMFCESQTLVDNITSEYEYTHEITTALDFDSTPTIAFTSSSDTFVFPISAGAPAISVPINSFGGDAGDKYNLTFGIRHNEEYSSFTAYDLNYTFSIDPHLRPDENMTICYSNASNASICEIVPFLNNTISGFLPV